jgi:choline dehydrogenase
MQWGHFRSWRCPLATNPAVFGVGPKALLQSLGIPVVLDLPGVGTNFQDQLNMPVTYNCEPNYLILQKWGCYFLILLRNLVTSNVFPNADSLQNNVTFFAEQLALYNSAHQGALTLTAQTGNNIVSLYLKETTSNWKALIALAASQDPASLLPPGSDPTVIKGCAAQ